ncbi:MAG: hypothetical protein ACYTG6_05645 [Planctomycetota bacterium]|jgi:hypothetical protein
MPEIRKPTLLVPAIGFVLTLGAAGIVTSNAQDRSAYRLYDRLADVFDEVTAGRAPTGAPPPDRQREADLARRYAGRLWVIHALTPRGEGRFEVVVGFYREDGSGHEERQIWEEGPDGRWHFLGLGAAGKGARTFPRGDPEQAPFQ